MGNNSMDPLRIEKHFQIACAIAAVLIPKIGWNPLLILICIHSVWYGFQKKDIVVRIFHYGLSIVLSMIIIFNIYNSQ